MDPTGLVLVNPVTIGAAIGGVTGAIQAANSNGGWTMSNAGAIFAGFATGAIAGAIPGRLPVTAGLGVQAAVGATAGAAGNYANQIAGCPGGSADRSGSTRLNTISAEISGSAADRVEFGCWAL
jgi:hypothetical protein